MGETILAQSNYYDILKSIAIASIIVFISFATYYLINIGNKYLNDKQKIIIDRSHVIKTSVIVISSIAIILLLRRYLILRIVVGSTIISIILTMIFNPVVTSLEKKKMNRTVATIFLYATICLVLVILFALVIPTIVFELRNFVASFDRHLNTVANYAEAVIRNLNLEKFGIKADIDYMAFFKDTDLIYSAKMWLSSVIQGASYLPSKMLSFFLIMVMTYFMLTEKEAIVNKVLELLPHKNDKDVEEYRELGIKIDQTIKDFIKGKIIMAFFVGVVTAIFLMIMGIDFAIIIGIVTFIADIVPYIGPFLGFLPAVFFAFISSPIKAIVVGIVFVIIQWLENNVIAPKVLSPGVGMHPLAVLLCIMVGGGMFGVLGMILSVPVVAVVYNIIVFFWEKRNKEKNRTVEE